MSFRSILYHHIPYLNRKTCKKSIFNKKYYNLEKKELVSNVSKSFFIFLYATYMNSLFVFKLFLFKLNSLPKSKKNKFVQNIILQILQSLQVLFSLFVLSIMKRIYIAHAWLMKQMFTIVMLVNTFRERANLINSINLLKQNKQLTTFPNCNKNVSNINKHFKFIRKD